ncbi:metallophosphoesterase family protein [Allofournierella sp. CML151]|uniref:metallophosphoesterase family protein n=1 Tax=Allofournierella sp. CML151 TaxID=2998082 RepID=UPI0022EB5622|nr:metallophosphoesterase [Fournierella sp. CML151]
MKFDTLILRFRDLVTADGETIAKHKEIIEHHEGEQPYVWWAWWSKGHEKLPFDELSPFKILANSTPQTLLLVDSGQKLVYTAVCTDIKFNVGDKKLTSPEESATPEYYRTRDYYAWFKFTKIEQTTPEVLHGYSYVNCKNLFRDDNEDYSNFDDKRIFSVKELIQQNRTMWFVRNAKETDRDNEIVLLNSEMIQPAHFSKRYYQSTGDTLMWLSDLHLADHVFPNDNQPSRSTLAEHLRECTQDKNIAALLISGDITSRGSEDGFRDAQNLLQDLNSSITLNSENILICPGNHDFAFKERLEDGLPEFISNTSEEAKLYSNFYRSVYHLPPNEYFACGKKLLLSSGHTLEIACLNSLRLQQYRNFEGHGYLSQEQLDFVANGMGWKDDCNNNKAIRIVMMHHHYLPTCYEEIVDVKRASSAVYDANRLMTWLAKMGVKLLLHGHKHTSFISSISCPSDSSAPSLECQNMKNIVVIGMGGTGAPNAENKFATMQFTNNKLVIEFHKLYSDKSSRDFVCQTIEIPL